MMRDGRAALASAAGGRGVRIFGSSAEPAGHSVSCSSGVAACLSLVAAASCPPALRGEDGAGGYLRLLVALPAALLVAFPRGFRAGVLSSAVSPGAVFLAVLARSALAK